MGKINVLDKQVAQLIAAGEVVERPASVIKEAVENSIDAGATTVTIEIQHGGISYMRVADNGSGIMRDDIRKAFLRHATSKVKNENDLDSITTLGFRGEALASICAVSKVSLLTKTEDELSGTSYIIEGGEEISLEDAGCPVGTTLIVKDLFYNTPARMKFLKKDMVEGNAVAAVIDKAALSHPEVGIRFIRDGKTVLQTQGDGKIYQAVYSVCGKDMINELMPVSYSLSGAEITGYISKPYACRPNRSMQNFFINGRYIKSRIASVALEEAYKGAIMVGKFPASFIYIKLSPDFVDVNVHPTKTEVRFINERVIFDCIYHAVKSSITKEDTPKEIKLQAREDNVNPKFIENIYAAVPQQRTFHNLSLIPSINTVQTQIPKQSSSIEELIGGTDFINVNLNDSGVRNEPVHTVENIEEKAAINTEENREELNYQSAKQNDEMLKSLDIPINIKCEVFDTYIIAQYGKDKLLLIDKHAAHERILYEKLKASAGANCQQLISPASVVLSKNEYAAVVDNLTTLERSGYEVEDFGAGTVLVRGIPLTSDLSDVREQIEEIAGYLYDNKTDITTEKLDWLYHNIACRSAVKAGNKSSYEELVDLAKKLYENPEIRYCPHGRPVYTVITKYELDKQFGRV